MGDLKLALQFKRVKDEIEREERKGMDPKKTLWKGAKVLGSNAVMLGGLAFIAALTDPQAIAKAFAEAPAPIQGAIIALSAALSEMVRNALTHTLKGLFASDSEK